MNDYGNDTFEDTQDEENSASLSYDPQNSYIGKSNVKSFSTTYFDEENNSDAEKPWKDGNVQGSGREKSEEVENDDELDEVNQSTSQQEEIEYDNEPPRKIKMMAFSGILYYIYSEFSMA